MQYIIIIKRSFLWLTTQVRFENNGGDDLSALIHHAPIIQYRPRNEHKQNKIKTVLCCAHLICTSDIVQSSDIVQHLHVTGSEPR